MADRRILTLNAGSSSLKFGLYAAPGLDAFPLTLEKPGTHLIAEDAHPSTITLSPDKRFLYAIHPSRAQATGFAVNADDGSLTPLPVSAPTAAAAASRPTAAR